MELATSGHLAYYAVCCLLTFPSADPPLSVGPKKIFTGPEPALSALLLGELCSDLFYAKFSPL